MMLVSNSHHWFSAKDLKIEKFAGWAALGLWVGIKDWAYPTGSQLQDCNQEKLQSAFREEKVLHVATYLICYCLSSSSSLNSENWLCIFNSYPLLHKLSPSTLGCYQKKISFIFLIWIIFQLLISHFRSFLPQTLNLLVFLKVAILVFSYNMLLLEESIHDLNCQNSTSCQVCNFRSDSPLSFKPNFHPAC